MYINNDKQNQRKQQDIPQKSSQKNISYFKCNMLEWYDLSSYPLTMD